MIEMRIVLYDTFTRTTRVVADGLHLLNYRPRAANPDVQYTDGRREGALPVSEDVGNVRDRVDVLALCDAPATLHSVTSALRMAYQFAADRRKEQQMYVQVRDPARHLGWFEARLYGGVCELSNSHGRLLDVTLIRHPYWRGVERLVSLRNTSGTGTSVVVYNHDDTHAGHNNWVVVSEAIGGTVPAETVVRITNNNDPQRIASVRMAWSDRPQAFTLEGETAIEGYPYGVVANDGLSNNAAATAPMLVWDVPNTSLSDYVGMYRVFSFGDLSGGNWRLKAGYVITPFLTLPYVTGKRGVTDLGLLALPVGGYVASQRAPTRIWLECEDDTQPGEVDFLLFLPTRQYRQVRLRNYYIVIGACIEDNGCEDELAYIIGDTALPIVAGYGDRIALHPTTHLPATQEQQISFVLEDALGRADALTTATIQMKVRERWDVLP